MVVDMRHPFVESSKSGGESFINSAQGLWSGIRPCCLYGDHATSRGLLLRSAPDMRPPKTSIRTFHKNLSSEWERKQEAVRRKVLMSMGHSTGFMPSAPACGTGRFESAAERIKRDLMRDQLRDKLINTPSAARRDARREIYQHNKLRPPSRSNVIAMHREGLRTAGGLRGGQHNTRVTVQPIGTIHPDTFATMELSNVDFLTTFYEMDSDSTGRVTRAQFEDVMLEIGYTPAQAVRIFDTLDVDRDGTISMADWMSNECATLSRLLIRKMLRNKYQRSMSKDADNHYRPRTTMTDHKVAMEIMLAKLGISAKSDFINIRDMFIRMDEDGSGDVDAKELGGTVEKILRQKISEGVKKQLMDRFDKSGDGKVSISEFIEKVVPSPLTLLYAYLPGSICLS